MNVNGKEIQQLNGGIKVEIPYELSVGENVTRAECAKMIQAVMNGIMDGKTRFIPMN